MTFLVPVAVVALLGYCVVAIVRRHRRGIVAERGISIGADLRAMNDQPRVRVRTLTEAGPDRFLLVLVPDDAADTGSDLELLVSLRDDAFGFELLHEWRRAQSTLALVMPPGSRIVRLRSLEDLQPLTLSRIDRDGET